jgi:hypothetical protein
MSTMTPDEASRVFKVLWAAIMKQLQQSADEGLRYAQALAVTKYMQGGGAGATMPGLDTGKFQARYQPANPPPGPLKIRSGDLRRTIEIIRAKILNGNELKGGLKGGSAKFNYMATHEFGATIQIPEIVAKPGHALAWPTTLMRGGKSGFGYEKTVGRGAGRATFGDYVVVKRVRAHKVTIPARPVIKPSLTEALPIIQMNVQTTLVQACNQLGL